MIRQKIILCRAASLFAVFFVCRIFLIESHSFRSIYMSNLVIQHLQYHRHISIWLWLLFTKLCICSCTRIIPICLWGAIILNRASLEVSQTYICPVIACICHLGIASYLRDVIWCYPSLHRDTTLIPSCPPKPHLTITAHTLYCTAYTNL